MPRKARIDMPGLLQHVIVRGIEKSKIFFNDDDRQIFLARFSSLLEETATDCFAWALLGNHFHLLLRCNRIELSNVMRRLLTSYAINFNHRHSRSGHLFQNRYKSIVCEEEVYLLELIRYIHLNPLRAEIVSDLESLSAYPWCGHAVLLGKGKLAGQVTDEVLRRFGENLSDARRNYRQFVADGVSLGKRPELVGGGLRRSQKASGVEEEMESFDDRVLGGGAFVEALQHDANLKAISPPKLTLLEIQKIAGELFEVEPDLILRRTKMSTASEARSIFCYIAVRLIGEKGIAVGEFLGMGPTGVSRAVRRGEQILHGRQALASRLKDLLSQ
jgi:REP element-mobilizing transposase RayT